MLVLRVLWPVLWLQDAAKKGKARSFKSVEPEAATMVNPQEVKSKRPPTALKARCLDDF